MVSMYCKSDLKELDQVIINKTAGPWNSGTMKIQVLSYDVERGIAQFKFVANPRLIGTRYNNDHGQWVNVVCTTPLQLVLNAYFF